MKIYFAGAIRSSREKVADYGIIVKKLQELGEVLTTHVADPKLSVNGEKGLTSQQIYERDMKWLNEADLVFADVSVPSLGVGYELGTAEKMGKRIICIHQTSSPTRLSAMIGGNKNFEIFNYENIDEVLEFIESLK